MSLFPASLEGITINNSAGTFKAQGFEEPTISRTYDGSASFARGASGSQIMGGPTYRQKYIWGIACKCTKAEALTLDSIFQAWDTARGNGVASVVYVSDQTFGTTVVAEAVFSTPPVYTRLSNGGNIYSVSFGLTEV